MVNRAPGSRSDRHIARNSVPRKKTIKNLRLSSWPGERYLSLCADSTTQLLRSPDAEPGSTDSTDSPCVRPGPRGCSKAAGRLATRPRSAISPRWEGWGGDAVRRPQCTAIYEVCIYVPRNPRPSRVCSVPPFPCPPVTSALSPSHVMRHQVGWVGTIASPVFLVFVRTRA